MALSLSEMLARWSRFVQEHEKSYVHVNLLAEHHRLETVRAIQGEVSQHLKKKLNLRIILNAAVHDMIKAMTIVLDVPWSIPSWATTDVDHPHGRKENDYTILMHPHLIAYLDIYQYTTRDIIEGLMFGDKDNFHRVSTSDLMGLPPINCDHRRVYNEIRPGIEGPRDD